MSEEKINRRFTVYMKSVDVSISIPISPRVLSSLRDPKAMAGRRMAM